MKDMCKIFFVLMTTSLLLTGCDKSCNKTVEDTAPIQNMTGRDLTLEVCKSIGNEIKQVTLSQSSVNSEVSLGTREDSEIKGGPTATCDGVKGGKVTTNLSLTSSSFGQVKLCTNLEGANVIVELYQQCPTGFLAQTSSDACRS